MRLPARAFLKEARDADPGAVQYWVDHYRTIGKLGGAAALIVHGKLAFEKAFSSKDQAQRQVVIDKPYELNKFGVRHWARQRTPRT